MSSSTQVVPMIFKITQRRSAIGFPENRKAVLRSIGLQKLHQTVYRQANPVMAGMIYKIKEILAVEVITPQKMEEELALKAQPKKPFFTLLKKANAASA